MKQRTDGNRGFALALVVFMLFAAAIAGITGYQIVSGEAFLADGNQNQDEAAVFANAGMQRYIGEHIGVPGNSTYMDTIVANGVTVVGSVTITPRKMAKLPNNDSTDLYLLTAVGTVTDPRYPTSPATRTVYQYANLNRRPVKPVAAFMTIQSSNNIGGNGLVNGTAQFSASGASVDCPSGDANGVGNTNSFGTATAAGGNAGGSKTIVPTGKQGYYVAAASSLALISAAGVRWSVLSDPTFPIPYDGTWPNFASIPSDSFPVVRVTGNYNLDRNGRGALIVTGTFTATGQGYTWKGIILAGTATQQGYNGQGGGNFINGVLISGLNNAPFIPTANLDHNEIDYYPCWVRKANLALAYLTPVSRSTWTF